MQTNVTPGGIDYGPDKISQENSKEQFMNIGNKCLFVAVALASSATAGSGGQLPATGQPPNTPPPATQEATTRPSTGFEKWQEAYLTTLDDIAALLRQTTDQHAVAQVKPKLEELTSRLSKLIAEGSKLSQADAPYLDPRAGELQAVINGQMYSMAGNPAVSSVLKPSLERLSQCLFGQGLSSPTTQPNWTFRIGSW
jgi:hypothetical protein